MCWKHEKNKYSVVMEVDLGMTRSVAAHNFVYLSKHDGKRKIGHLQVENRPFEGGHRPDAILSLVKNQRGHVVLVVESSRVDRYGRVTKTERRVRIT
jgi:hypothetical protein